MIYTLQDYRKKHDFLVCVDSDGCAVDNMSLKHLRCFAPCLIHEWSLEDIAGEVTALWGQINLYGLTRGINRFRALALLLEHLHGSGRKISGLPDLTEWLDEAETITHETLKEKIRKTDSPILKKALRWSEQSNRAIDSLPQHEKKFFEGFREALEGLRCFADIVVISGTDRETVEKEWRFGGMLDLADALLCQEAGNKAACVAGLCGNGYPESNVMIIGDAPTDRAAAELNGAFFYPILAHRETESWKSFPAAAEQFRAGTFSRIAPLMAEEFIINLSGGNIRD